MRDNRKYCRFGGPTRIPFSFHDLNRVAHNVDTADKFGWICFAAGLTSSCSRKDGSLQTHQYVGILVDEFDDFLQAPETALQAPV